MVELDRMTKEFNLKLLVEFLKELDGVVVEHFENETIISFYVREVHNEKNVELCSKNYDNYRKIFKFQKQRKLPKKIVSSLLVGCCKRLDGDIRKSTKHYKVVNDQGNEIPSTSGHYKIMIH